MDEASTSTTKGFGSGCGRELSFFRVLKASVAKGDQDKDLGLPFNRLVRGVTVKLKSSINRRWSSLMVFGNGQVRTYVYTYQLVG